MSDITAAVTKSTAAMDKFGKTAEELKQKVDAEVQAAKSFDKAYQAWLEKDTDKTRKAMADAAEKLRNARSDRDKTQDKFNAAGREFFETQMKLVQTIYESIRR